MKVSIMVLQTVNAKTASGEEALRVHRAKKIVAKDVKVKSKLLKKSTSFWYEGSA